MNSRSARRGLTRCDVIAVMVLGMMLFALAAPAVCELRASSARTECVDNLRQLALAAFNHESVLKRYPLVSNSQGALTSVVPATVGDKPAATAGYSFHANLLPFLEEDLLYNELRKNSNKFLKPPFDEKLLRADGKTHLASTKIPALVCPAMKQETVDPQLAALVDGKRTNVKTEYAAWSERHGTPALSSYVGIVGTHYDARDGLLENGGMVSRCKDKDGDGNCIGKGLRIREFGDGTAKTLLFSESRETAYAAWIDGQAMWVVGLDGTGKIGPDESGFLSAERSLLNAGPDAEKMEIAPTYSDLGLNQSKAWPGKAPRRYGPSSRHANGAINHAFCDAHVMSISAEIDPAVYARLITRNAGDPVGEIKEAPLGEAIDEAKVPMELRATIDNGIALIEKKDLEGFIKALAAPDDLKKFTANQSLAEVSKALGERGADQEILQALKATENPETEIRTEGGDYIFKFEKRIGGHETMKFVKIDGRWYLRN